MQNIIRLLSLDPFIGAIAAGNAVVLKPSEVSCPCNILDSIKTSRGVYGYLGYKSRRRWFSRNNCIA
ncbi:hypothetical protein CASFOL_017258 [Castilleja foliolosa]|uniref:Aldehyde dehydrogenase domain-containing protein n=1 Tax=Castilleja foliolosa TaxID=1961234 RepID=A0ABD3DAL2_9LAMI